MNAPEQTTDTTIQPATSPPAVNTPLPAVAQETPEAKEIRERDEAGRFRNPLQPRIDELTRDKHAAKREADYWKQRAESAEKPPEPPKAKPVPEQFDDYSAYVEALTDWKAEGKVKESFEARDKANAEKQSAEKRASNWSEREARVREQMSDYDTVMRAADVPIATHVEELLLESEEGPRVALHLAKHPDIATKLNGMTPLQAAREIGRLEMMVAVPAAEPAADSSEAPAIAPAPEIKPPKTTAAPPPARPVASGRTTTVPLDKMGMDEYVAARRAQGASWARR